MSLIKVTGQEKLYAVEIEIGAANRVKIWPPTSTERILRGRSKRNAANYSVWKTEPAAKKPPRNSE